MLLSQTRKLVTAESKQEKRNSTKIIFKRQKPALTLVCMVIQMVVICHQNNYFFCI